MTDRDLGIIGGRHEPTLTQLEAKCVAVLRVQGSGRESAIPAERLALHVFGRWGVTGGDEALRDLRRLVNHLIITHGQPIISKAGKGGGYYLPATEEEVIEYYHAFHRRAMTGLLKASRGKKSAFVELLGQLAFGFDEPEMQEVLEALDLTPDVDPVPAFVGVITQGLERLAVDPQRYAEEIRQIQRAYGDIFVPREKVRLLKEKTEEFQQLLREIA